MNGWRVGANLATLANAVLGVGGIVYVLAGNKQWALLLLLGAIGFDGLDGILSRRAGGVPSAFGRVADSVADAVSFGLGPGFLVAVHTDNQPLWAPWGTEALLAGALVSVLALARLVYFTLRSYRLGHFAGASTPQTTLAIALLVLLWDVPGYLGTAPLLFLLGASLLAVLMVVPIPYPKMRRGEPFRLPMTVTAVAAAFAIVPIQFRPAMGSPLGLVAAVSTVVLAIGTIAYYVLGPFSVRAAAEGAGGASGAD